MKNKKSMEANPMSLVIVAAILGVVLLVFIYGILPILTGKQIPFIKGQTEQVTEDCDEDGVIGLNDPCPCDKSIKSQQELEKANNKCSAVIAGSEATKNCPSLCKGISIVQTEKKR